MTKKDLVIRKRTIERAIRMNEHIIKTERSPHMKDVARYRIGHLTRKLEELKDESIK